MSGCVCGVVCVCMWGACVRELCVCVSEGCVCVYVCVCVGVEVCVRSGCV